MAKNQTETDKNETTAAAPGEAVAAKPADNADAYYADMLAKKIAAGLSKEDAETVVKWQREEDAKLGKNKKA